MYRFQFTPKPFHIEELRFAGRAPNGDTVSVNSRYFVRNGKPWYPIMGEFHFSRYAAEEWERELLKMKAGGIDIVATYIFWIHHEEEEGVWDFSGQRDLRRFVELCAKHGLYVCLRVGPWAHGECRNGGLPDWLRIGEGNAPLGIVGNYLRSNDPRYLGYVDRYFAKIAEQTADLVWEKGGPVMSVQVENEYYFGEPDTPSRLCHMLTLKKMLIKHGFRVPVYTATGWGGAAVPEGEMLPVFGCYCDAPWDGSIKELTPSASYLFHRALNDPAIGSDQRHSGSSSPEEYTCDVTRYPFLTAELGGGNQSTDHRRVYCHAKDTEGLAFCKVGSGANLLGYYMYHGGTNPEGRLSTMQESKATGYSNDLPVKSYDFDAPLGEWGEVKESYHLLRRLHIFLHTWGDIVARAPVYIPEWSCTECEDCETVRLSVRHEAESGCGFIFINNHLRRRTLREHTAFSMTVETPEMTIETLPIDILANGTYILPYNLPLGRAVLKRTNACPLTAIGNRYFFYTDDLPIYEFSGKSGDTFATLPDIVTLLERDSRHAYRFGDKLYIADCAMYEKDGTVYAEITKDTKVTVYEETGDPTVLFLECESGVYTAECAVAEQEDGGYILTPEYTEDGEHLLLIDYVGDKAMLYDADGKLVSDWFTTGREYCPSLAMLGNPESLRLVLTDDETPRYFDIPRAKGCRLNRVSVILRHTVEVDTL